MWRASPLHPDTLSCYDPEGAVADWLAQVPPDAEPTWLRISLARGHVYADQLIANGFSLMERTRLVTLTSRTADPEDRFSWVDAGAGIDWQAWCAAVWASYERTHPVNPPQKPSDWVDCFLDQDLVAALSVTGQNGQIIGFASLHTGQEVGWLDADEPSLIPRIIAQTRSEAERRGWSDVTFEFDDMQPELWAALPPKADDQWFEAWFKQPNP